MRTILNIIWFVCGGFVMGLGWWLAGLLAAISIIGIPWARACFMFGNFCFRPFGREAIDRRELTGRGDLGTGALGFVGNVVWFLLAGVWLAIGHIGSAVACFATIIGIPFGIQHVKLALCALAPVGKTVVTGEEAAAARRRNATYTRL
ncbi:MAG: YccF domain-containing protein [Deltaproteobacteria bacterium]|nr:YccF domain-containing protein [Deltaproteobacteria bacterium]MCW5802517.1 YccF domain-containing protein [Deltaproteobacteria bacterium]